MHHALHKVVKRMGGQTSKARGARGVRGVHTFLIAKNAPKVTIGGGMWEACATTWVASRRKKQE